MDPFTDIENLIKVLFLVVIFGGWILKTVLQNLLKPGEKRPGQEGGQPAKSLREFLEEIRQEEAGGGPPARQAPPAQPDEELIWEEVEDVEEVEEAMEPPRPAARQGQRTAFDERREQWRRETERRRAERDRQRQERARRRREEDEARRAAELERQQQWRSVAERHLDSTLDERRIGSDLDDRRLQSHLADRRIAALGRAAGSPRAGRARAAELVGPLRGLTVRDLILADVILGKPRSRRRRIRDA